MMVAPEAYAKAKNKADEVHAEADQIDKELKDVGESYDGSAKDDKVAEAVKRLSVKISKAAGVMFAQHGDVADMVLDVSTLFRQSLNDV